MKRKLTALLLAVLTLCLCTGAMAAGYPIDTQGKDVSLTVYCANAISNYVTDYNETPFFQEMEKAHGHPHQFHPSRYLRHAGSDEPAVPGQGAAGYHHVRQLL